VIANSKFASCAISKTELLTRALQPAALDADFGEVLLSPSLNPYRLSGTYLDFFAPGILAQSVLFAAIFYMELAIIWERDPRDHPQVSCQPPRRDRLLCLSKALSAGVRGLSHSHHHLSPFFLVARECTFSWNPLSLLGIASFRLPGMGSFLDILTPSSHCIVKTRENVFMALGQVHDDAPLLCEQCNLSDSDHAAVVEGNCTGSSLTYEVDALRGLMLVGGTCV